MTIEIIGLVTLAIGILALFLGSGFAVRAFVPMCLLGSAGAVLLGGAGTIQPAHLLLGFVAFAVFADPRRFAAVSRASTFPREGFWLAVVTVYGVASAYFLPRLFAGFTGINAIGATDYGPSLLLVPLSPTSGNVTQSIYVVADLVCFFTFVTLASEPRGFRVVLASVLSYCVANIAFAAIDIATSATGTGFLLGFMRNADYALHDDDVVGGMKRIIGSFTEASSFSYATVGSLGFTARLLLAGRRPRLMGGLSLLSFLLLLFSTSSTAYVATPGLLAALYGGCLIRLARRGARPATFAFLLFVPLMMAVIAAAVMLNPSVSNELRDFINTTVLSKSTSESGLERAQWNQTALRNFFDTWWMGGGLGSIRASSFPIAVLSNLGVLGTLGFAGFLQSVLLFGTRDGDRHDLDADVRAAACMACVGLLIAATVSGALVDLGLPFYIFAALACATPRVHYAPTRMGQSAHAKRTRAR